MKRWLAYTAALILLAVFPLQGTDVGKLAPVEAVWLTEQNGQIYLQTDTGDVGRGEDVRSALQNMKATAYGTIFLDTADYLIVQEGKETLLQQVYDVLRPSCMVCSAAKIPDLERAVEFLAAHEPEITLRAYRVTHNSIPKLTEQEGRYKWFDS